MSYFKGNAHTIPAMASKSCAGISARDLYVPLTATVSTNTTNRTFTVEVVASCYFGTRINIDNTFHSMTLNGQNVNDKEINGWVSQDEPGKEIARLTINGTYNAEGKPSFKVISVPFSGSMTYYKDVGCHNTAERSFSNSIIVTIGDIEPHYVAPAEPTITNVVSLDDALLVDASVSSFGEGGGKYLYVEASKTADFAKVKTSEVINELSGTCRISNLQNNTKYYLRAVAENNGSSTYMQTPTEGYTLAASQITSLQSSYGNMYQVSVSVEVRNGAGANEITNRVQYSKDNGITWTALATNHYTTNFAITGAGDWQPNNFLLFRVQTTTENVGVYTSNVVEYTIPDGLSGYVAQITSTGGTTANVRIYVASSTSGNVSTTVYYRPYGTEEEWVKAGNTTPVQANTFYNTSITNLNPNYAKYEISLNLKKGQKEYDTEPVTFYTIPVAVSNDTCESLDYMVQLICQTYKAIQNGNIVVYMNDDTKGWCEGEDGIPTLAAIMSRINRFMHAVACTLCSMEGFIELLKQSDSNQVFMGSAGWVDCDDEPTAGSTRPVTSDGIYQAIDELVRQVWHYVGEYDYYAENPLELNAQSGTAVNQTAVMGNKKYKWNGSSWVEDGTPVMENFGVIHINGGRHADKAYYWFVDGWNRLDADTEEIEDRLEALENTKFVETINSDQYKIATADGSLTSNQVSALIPTDATMDTIILLTATEQADETTLTVLPS